MNGKSTRPISFKYSRTRIGGRQIVFRFRGLLLHLMATWGVPWQAYIKPVECSIHRVKFGLQGHHRAWKPYFRWQVQWFPSAYGLGTRTTDNPPRFRAEEV